MAITVRETTSSQIRNSDNPDGVTYRLFDCPLCGFTIAFRLKNVIKCRRCEQNIVDVLRLITNSRYRLCYHKYVVDDKGQWDWTENDNVYC